MKTRKCGCEKDVFVCQSHVRPQHTPTPWYESQIADGTWVIGAGQDHWAEDLTQEDAEFIVRAVNSHELLLTALKCLVNGYEPYSGCNLERARQAIAKAEGK